MISIEKPVTFHDDRAKDDRIIRMTKILFQNESVCLCLTDDPELGEVLFRIADGEVISDNLAFWYATNAPLKD